MPEMLRNRTLWAVSVVGAVSLILGAQAYQMAAVATVSFLLLLVPVFAGLLAPLYGERLTRRDLVGLGIGLVGVAFFAQPSPAFDTEWLGIVLALLCGLPSVCSGTNPGRWRRMPTNRGPRVRRR